MICLATLLSGLLFTLFLHFAEYKYFPNFKFKKVIDFKSIYVGL